MKPSTNDQAKGVLHQAVGAVKVQEKAGQIERVFEK